MAEILTVIAFGIIIMGSLWFLVAAFQESFFWGLGCLLLSPVSLIFLLTHWREAKGPFFMQLAGIALFGVVAYLSEGQLRV